MTSPEDLSARLNACRYLYMRSLTQDQDGPLTLIVEEHAVGEPEPDPMGGMRSPIQLPDRGLVFMLVWDTYVSYSVTDDSFPPADEAETGRQVGWWRESARSDFLDYLRSTKVELFDPFERCLKCWRVTTLNRYLEVVSYSPAQIAVVA